MPIPSASSFSVGGPYQSMPTTARPRKPRPKPGPERLAEPEQPAFNFDHRKILAIIKSMAPRMKLAREGLVLRFAINDPSVSVPRATPFGDVQHPVPVSREDAVRILSKQAGAMPISIIARTPEPLLAKHRTTKEATPYANRELTKVNLVGGSLQEHYGKGVLHNLVHEGKLPTQVSDWLRQGKTVDDVFSLMEKHGIENPFYRGPTWHKPVFDHLGRLTPWSGPPALDDQGNPLGYSNQPKYLRTSDYQPHSRIDPAHFGNHPSGFIKVHPSEVAQYAQRPDPVDRHQNQGADDPLQFRVPKLENIVDFFHNGAHYTIPENLEGEHPDVIEHIKSLRPFIKEAHDEATARLADRYSKRQTQLAQPEPTHKIPMKPSKWSGIFNTINAIKSRMGISTPGYSQTWRSPDHPEAVNPPANSPTPTPAPAPPPVPEPSQVAESERRPGSSPTHGVSKGTGISKLDGVHPLLAKTRLASHLRQLQEHYAGDAGMVDAINRALSKRETERYKDGVDPFSEIGKRLKDDPRMKQWARAYRWDKIASGMEVDKKIHDAVKKLVRPNQKDTFLRFVDQLVARNRDGEYSTEQEDINDMHNRRAGAIGEKFKAKHDKAWEALRGSLEGLKIKPENIDKIILHSLLRHAYREQDEDMIQSNSHFKPTPAGEHYVPNEKQKKENQQAKLGGLPYFTGRAREMNNPERYRRSGYFIRFNGDYEQMIDAIKDTWSHAQKNAPKTAQKANSPGEIWDTPISVGGVGGGSVPMASGIMAHHLMNHIRSTFGKDPLPHMQQLGIPDPTPFIKGLPGKATPAPEEPPFAEPVKGEPKGEAPAALPIEPKPSPKPVRPAIETWHSVHEPSPAEPKPLIASPPTSSHLTPIEIGKGNFIHKVIHGKNAVMARGDTPQTAHALAQQYQLHVKALDGLHDKARRSAQASGVTGQKEIWAHNPEIKKDAQALVQAIRRLATGDPAKPIGTRMASGLRLQRGSTGSRISAMVDRLTRR